MRFKDKVAIITGSARGLGKEYALAFSREGAKVVVCDIVDCAEAAKEIESMGGEALSLITDVSSGASTVDMASKTNERFGRIDILVNNAAIYGGISMKPFYEFTEAEWDKLMAVNLKGMFLCCKAIFPYMKEQGKGKIVNIASAVAFLGVPYHIHYTTSKGGVIAFTRAMARELGDYNITINAVAPGLVMTKASLDMVPDSIIEGNITSLCLKRRQQPADLIGATLFLASQESDFITGQTIVVDGGSALH